MSDAILGTFVKIGTMSDGTPRLVLDLQCTLSEVASMGLIPGVPFAVARIKKEAAITPQEEPKERPGQLCVMACTFCADKQFWRWIQSVDNNDCNSAEAAKEFICTACNIESRKELDTSIAAARLFHEEIRKPFVAWRAA